MSVKIVDEPNWGVYVWRLPNGKYASDGNGYMLIQSMRGDLEKIEALAKAAKQFGCYDGGVAEFKAGQRPVTDEEYDEQMLRLKFGLTPDPLDLQVMKEEEKFRAYGKR